MAGPPVAPGMLRALLLAGLLLTLGVAAAPAAAAEEVRVGPCEIDGCVYACVAVTESCRGDHLFCTFFAFQVWCLP